MLKTFSFGTLELKQGDLTREPADAIVNAANSSLMGGGGVDGAIHRGGGPAILEECKGIVRKQGRLPPGNAVITTAGNLPAHYVIHTVGPIWRGGGQGEESILEHCYRNSLELANEHGLSSVAFPSISTGAYGYPVEKAARVAIGAVVNVLEKPHGTVEKVIFVLFDPATLRAYEAALSSI